MTSKWSLVSKSAPRLHSKKEILPPLKRYKLILIHTTIQQLEQEGTYKYLAVNEGDGIQHAKMKEKIKKEYYRRIRIITKSELNAINRMEAINTLATPVVTYSFNIVDWKMEEIRKLDRKTRKLLTMEGCTTQEQTWIECTSTEIRAVEA